MKKIIILFICTVFVFASCEKYLEVNPKNVLTSKTYQDVKILMGGYLLYYKEGKILSNTTDAFTTTYDDTYFTFNYYADDLDTDTYLEGSWLARNNRGLFLQSLDWHEGNLHARLWSSHYKNIGFFNTILYELEKHKSDITADEYNMIAGEAKFLRAFQLFKLLQYFSPYNNDELGIPVNLDPTAISTYDSKRKTQTEVYKIIIDDLEEILTYTTVPSSTYNIFYDKDLVHALLAKVYHYKGGSGAGAAEDYTKAIEHAKAAIQNKQITSIDKMDDLFINDERGIVKNTDYALIAYYPFWYSNGGITNIVGYQGYNHKMHMREDLYNLFSNDDIRKTKFASEGALINKFSNLGYGSTNKYYFFRVAELELIIAESYALSGDNANAKIHLEKLQINRIENYTGYNGSDILQEIRDERRRELCFEYDIRWTDLHRYQTGWSRNALDLTEEGQIHTIENNDYRFTLPIPLSEELDYNNQIEQNPGWTIF